MFLAILSGASIGPVFKYMETQHIHPLQAAAWRCTCMSIWLTPFAVIEALKSSPEMRMTWFTKYPDLPFPVYVLVLFAGIVWAGNLLTWISGLQFTTTVRAALFCNLHPLIMVVVLYLAGMK